MPTITIKRVGPVSVFYPDSTLTTLTLLGGIDLKPAVMNHGTLSLSGLPDDYDWYYTRTESTVFIATKTSYQDCFKAQKTRLELLEERLARKEQADEYAENVIKRSQTYTRMG